ncbi:MULTISPECIES: ATP-binding cassette domain-containing protein [Roseomonadaceae]|uniref:ATP-binding cassette domain-containing protein n=1 Tax=Falsiroseomonas oleicola TaxID=2801474 RepID=A0ABS6HCU2_9PROT|nr:ATP-binding cassette domain-containing protein [Roseomonas oleicola]MBU8545306.1 ATP-binding cassette domain-containing protein [Roseomonas oleicola]
MPDDQTATPPAATGATPVAPEPPPSFPLPAHAPLVLDDPVDRWLVASGSVTLFASRPARAPATEGPRRYLGTVPAGGLVCGLGIDDIGAQLIAVGTADTRLSPLPPAAPDETPEDQTRLAIAVTAWCRALAEGLARPMAPRPRADIAISDIIGPVRTASGATIAARGNPIWVRLPPGSWLLLGLEPVEGLVPLPPEAWLTGSGGVVEPVPVAKAMADADWVAGLARFNAACLAALSSALALDAADELNRLRLRTERDEEAGAEQRSAFAAILGNAPEAQAGADADPLMPIFRIVAAHMGVRAKRPIRVRRADIDAVPTLEELARASGLRLRPAHLPENWWLEDHGPLFSTLGSHATVALLPDGRGYRLFSADKPKGIRLDATLAKGIGRDALTPIVPLPRKALGLLDLLGSGMRGSGGDVTAIFVTMLVGAALGQAVPMATGVAFSLLIPGGHMGELAQLGMALVLVAAVSWMVKLGSEIARERIEAQAGPALHAAIWDRVMRLPLATLNRQTVGETSGRAVSAISLAVQLRAFGFVIVSAVATILSSMLLMVLSQPLAAAVAVGMLVLQLAAANLAGWLQARAFATGEALSGLADAMVFQIVSGLVKLRLAGAEARAQTVWAGRFAEMRRRLAAARRISNGYDAFAAGFAVLSTAAAFLIIALMQRVEVGEPPPSLSSVMTFIAAYGLMAASGTQLAKTMFALWFLMPTRKFAQPLLDALPEPDTGKVDPGRLSGAVELSNLAFRYGPTEAWVFAGLTLRIEPGEFIAIVGRSGAGKSTLVRLLLGMEEPSNGAIYMDGHDIRGLDLAVLRQQVATVLQAGRISPGSLRDAVRGLSRVPDEDIWQALEQAALAADVRAMPMGLETMLTDASRVLSGGQVQRLLLARALLQKPAILILDEATSALDNVTQRATMRAIRTMPATRIVIAHRLSTIRHADRIIVLDGGRIVESGSFEQLLARKGGYFARQYAEEARWQAASHTAPASGKS